MANPNAKLLCVLLLFLPLVAGFANAAELPAPSRLVRPIGPSRQIGPHNRPGQALAHSSEGQTVPSGHQVHLPGPINLPDGGELITERYPDRSVKIQRGVKQDVDRNYVNHGLWIMWDPRGRVIAQGEYSDGKREGQWMRTLPDFAGVLPGFQAPFNSQATFDRGKLHGVWTVLDSQNRIVGSWEFDQGVLEGQATIWYAAGQQKQEMTFRKGLPDGEATAWREDGKIWAREFYRRGKQLVPHVNWYDQKQKESEGWLLRSNIDWSVNTDWSEGIIEIGRTETTGEEEVRVGKWTEWHLNGALRYSGTFEDGLPSGEHSWWHENGQRLLSGNYEEGQRDGRWTMWHPNGQKQEEGVFFDGMKDGEWIAWTETGEALQVQQLAADPSANEELSLDGEPFSHISLD